MNFPTLTKVIVFPRLSHLEWKILEFHPSEVALQQHFNLLNENHCLNCFRKFFGSPFRIVELEISPMKYCLQNISEILWTENCNFKSHLHLHVHHFVLQLRIE